MAVRYALYLNGFKKKQQEYEARVIPKSCCRQKELIRLMKYFNPSLTEANINGVLDTYALTIGHVLNDGRSVSTPLIKIQASIYGKFKDLADRFYPSRHKVNLNITPGNRLQEIAKELKTEKIEARRPTPYLSTLEDIFSDTEDKHITCGGMVRLRGNNLKYDADQARQGVFLISENHQETRIEKVIDIKPSYLLLQIPANLPLGKYTLEVRARVGNCTAVRTGSFSHTLTLIRSQTAN